MLNNRFVEMLDCLGLGVQPLVLFFRSTANPTPYPLFSRVPLVMPFARDSILELGMTLVRLSGAKSLRIPLVSQILGEWVASSPLAKPRWVEATLATPRLFVLSKWRR